MAKRKFNIPAEEFEIEERKESGKKIKIQDLVADAENITIYGENDPAEIEALTIDIRKNGFKGAILAYPNDAGKYVIESGHRRAIAAKAAGLTEIPVILTEKPKTDAERRIRLISMNLHTRETLKPSVMAKVIDTLVESFEGRDQVTQTAKLLGKSVSTVYKYRKMKDLTPGLQKLADEGVAWSALIQIPKERQKEAEKEIAAEIERIGVENITRAWVLSFAKEKEEPKEEIRIVTRRRDGSKIIKKCLADFADLKNGVAMLKDEDNVKNIEQLKQLRDYIDDTLYELTEKTPLMEE